MKKLLVILFAGATALWSCVEGGKVASNGGLYEIFVVCDDEKWNGAPGDTLRAIFSEPVDMINQYEASFSVLRVAPQAFGKIIGRHRNLLFIQTGSEFAEASMTAEYDVYAAPQIVVRATGPTAESITGYFSEHRAEVARIFELAERDRNLAAAKAHNEKSLMNLVENKFGMKIDIPLGYKLRSEGDDFIWISHERPQVSQGFMIYSYPCEGVSDFDSVHLTTRRNAFVSRIPGPSDGSYMTTYTDDPMLYPKVRYITIGGRQWARMAGFWEVHGDFMGGPFISYSTPAGSPRRVVTIDCYLFSPKQPKRNFLKQLDHLVYSAEFPGDNR